MTDYNDIQDVKTALTKAQDAEEDNRARVREVNHFLEKDDGQWEPEIIRNMVGKPRYTFDKCNPVVDSIAGELEQANFAIRVRPSGGQASKEVASIMAGMVRNIESMSKAQQTYNAAGRKMVKSGFDAWLVKQDWVDGESFDQDLIIQKIANAVDRVWFDENAQEQDMSDANHGFLLHVLTKDKFKEKWGRDGQSLGSLRTNQVYTYKPDFITFGQIFYKQPVKKELVLMSDQKVYVVDEDYEKVKDELAQQGITELRRRTRKSHIVHSRFFDNEDFLDSAKETVFKWIPIVPTYANFDVSEDKIIYRGAVNKLMDAQRVYNYAQSRQIEEGALAPRQKKWMTKEQAQGHEASIRTLNTNADPVQFYNYVPDQPQPFDTGGAEINPGLAQVANDMKGNIIEGSGIFAANQGNAPNQSGYAIELQQNKGDNSSIKYFTSQEIAIEHTARILIDAIPKAYDSDERIVRVLGEDGVDKMETINRKVFDEETGETVVLNDVRQGKYDVVCDVGPAFKNQQQATSKAFLEVAAIDPTIIQQGKDIFLSNLSVPGMDAMAERARKQLFETGQIPDNQMTEEEKQRAAQLIQQAQMEQAAAAQQGPSIMEQAVIEQTRAQTAETQSRAQERMGKVMNESRKIDLKETELSLKAGDQNTQAMLNFEKLGLSRSQALATLNLKRQTQQLDEAKFVQQSQNDAVLMLMKQNQAVVEALSKQAEMLNTQADTLKTIREAIGKDVTIVGPGNMQNYIEQTEAISDAQENLELS